MIDFTMKFFLGAEWKKAKKIMESGFPYSTLKTFVSIMRAETKVLMQRLEKEEGKTSFLMYPYLKACTFDIICSEYSFFFSSFNIEIRNVY